MRSRLHHHLEVDCQSEQIQGVSANRLGYSSPAAGASSLEAEWRMASEMIGGYMGKMLLVDLTTGPIAEEKLEEKVCRDLIGGAGFGVRTVYEGQKSTVDALVPPNILGSVTGPLTGSGVPGASTYQVVTKSQRTGKCVGNRIASERMSNCV